MTNPLELLLPGDPDPQSRVKWATVASVSPLRIWIDQETAPLAGTPDTLVHLDELQEGTRVSVLKRSGKNNLIIGVAGGIPKPAPLLAASLAQMIEGESLDTYASPGTLFEMLEHDGAWRRCIPSSVTNQVGAPLPFDPVTGVVSLPAGTPQVIVNGVFENNALYEYMLKSFFMPSGVSGIDGSIWMRMTQGGVVSSASGYQFGGNWSMYNGTTGTYSANAGTACPVGLIASDANFYNEIVISPQRAGSSLFVDMHSMTQGSARSTRGNGYTISSPSGRWDGFNFYPTSGTLQGDIHVFKRRIR